MVFKFAELTEIFKKKFMWINQADSQVDSNLMSQKNIGSPLFSSQIIGIATPMQLFGSQLLSDSQTPVSEHQISTPGVESAP